MLHFSLKDAFYWLTVWIVGVSILLAILGPPTPASLVAITIWFAGTVATNKAFGSKSSLAFAVVAAISACMFAGALFSEPRNPPSEIVLGSIVSGLVGGSLMWLVCAAADSGYNWLTGRAG
jgi:hypothetical protein